MARSYCAAPASTLIAASATLPFMTLISTAGIRPRIYDIICGSDSTPADSDVTFKVQRCTTAGTVGSSVIPSPIDSYDPACLASCGLATFSAGPTLTANTFLLEWAQNQRGTFRWVAVPGKELALPAVASNGVAFMTPTLGGSAFNAVLCVSFEE